MRKRCYNAWYSSTYEAILDMGPWDDLASGLEQKIVCIFAWMPQTIMRVRDRNGLTKADLYSAPQVAQRLLDVKDTFNAIRHYRLLDVRLEDIKDPVRRVCDVLFPLFGSVAASKYLHFSAPCLFPMWDQYIRSQYRQKNSVAGYFAYMGKFREELSHEANLEQALRAYVANPIRGWDIVNMGNRGSKSRTSSDT